MKIYVKTMLCLLTFCVLTFVSVYVFAAGGRPNAEPGSNEISQDDICIGGLTFGVAEDYVRQIYGEPDDIDYNATGQHYKTRIYNYGNSFFVEFNDKNTVLSVKTTANNGLGTPPGFTVGMPISKVEQYYGVGKGSKYMKDGQTSIRYSAKWWMNMLFVADSKGIIKEIRIYPTP